MKCPHCQAENPEDAKFCINCGQSLQTEIKCSSCGKTSPAGSKFCKECGHSLTEQLTKPPKPKPKKPSTIEPTSFADGRYQVKKFFGEGGKKKVYLAHDTLLDRDVAFALIKTEKLDDDTRKRITREAQALVPGCTDVPLVVKASHLPVPVFDSTEILAEPTVKFARSDTMSS